MSALTSDIGAGARLRSIRRERGISLADLSRRTFYSKGYLSKIENGEKPLTAEVVRAYARVLEGSGVLELVAPEATAARPRELPDAVVQARRPDVRAPHRRSRPGVVPRGCTAAAGPARLTGRGDELARLQALVAELTELLRTLGLPGPS